MNKCPKCGEQAKFDDFFCQTCGTALISPERPKTKQLMSYIQIIGIVEIVLGIFGLVGAGLIGFLAYILPRVMELEEVQTDIPEPIKSELFDFLWMFLLLIAVLLVIYAIASIWFGIRLLQYKNSGRIGTMIIGALSIINIPLGTAFGLAALYILTKPEAEALFD